MTTRAHDARLADDSLAGSHSVQRFVTRKDRVSILLRDGIAIMRQHAAQPGDTKIQELEKYMEWWNGMIKVGEVMVVDPKETINQLQFQYGAKRELIEKYLPVWEADYRRMEANKEKERAARRRRKEKKVAADVYLGAMIINNKKGTQ